MSLLAKERDACLCPQRPSLRYAWYPAVARRRRVWVEARLHQAKLHRPCRFRCRRISRQIPASVARPATRNPQTLPCRTVAFALEEIPWFSAAGVKLKSTEGRCALRTETKLLQDGVLTTSLDSGGVYEPFSGVFAMRQALAVRSQEQMPLGQNVMTAQQRVESIHAGLKIALQAGAKHTRGRGRLERYFL